MPQSVQRYHLVRILITLAVLGWVLGLAQATGWASMSLVPFFRGVAVVLLGLVLTLRWGSGDRRGPSLAILFGHLMVDATAVSLLSGMTGGLHSFFTLLYFPIIAAGAYLLRQRGALWSAAFVSIGFAGMLAAHGDIPSLAEEGALLIYTEGMFRIFAFFLMALLTGHLGELLARTGMQLQEERRSARLLATEHDTVLERVRAGVVSTDAAGKIVSLNAFARALLGDVRDAALVDVLPGAAGHDTWEESLPGGRRWICTGAGLPQGGRVVVVEDISELSHMRESAAHQERMVSVGRLAASMAHEIRNPLASLSGSLQLIREDRPSRLADLALGEAERLNRLVEDFLSMARRPVVVPQRVDLHVIASEVCESFTRDPRYVGKVTARCHGVSQIAEVDPDRIRQALWNLVLNGAQAMPRGGAVTVTLKRVPAFTNGPQGVEIVVSDEGIGIPEAELGRLFDPFRTTRSGGTGLGLVLVEQTVRAHGGYISVRPRAGPGTEFQLWLPKEALLGG